MSEPYNFGVLMRVVQELPVRYREDPLYPGSKAPVFRGLLACGHQVRRGELVKKGSTVRCFRCQK